MSHISVCLEPLLLYFICNLVSHILLRLEPFCSVFPFYFRSSISFVTLFTAAVALFLVDYQIPLKPLVLSSLFRFLFHRCPLVVQYTRNIPANRPYSPLYQYQAVAVVTNNLQVTHPSGRRRRCP